MQLWPLEYAGGGAGDYPRQRTTAPHHPDQRDLTQSFARTLEACCHWRPWPPVTIFDSTFCALSYYNTMESYVHGYACALVVFNMRALDSYCDWLRMSARLRAFGETHARYRQRLGNHFVALTGLKGWKAALQPASRVTRLALAGKKRRRLQGRCDSTIITEKTHDSCASLTAL